MVEKVEKKKNGFNLLLVIIIMVVTAIISSVATGVIMLNNKTSIAQATEIEEDENLAEFIEVYNTLKDRYYDEVNTKKMLEAAEEGMVNYLGDKYTTYLDDKQSNEIIEELKGTYKGIGVSVYGNVVKAVTTNSPAEKVGMKANDIIQAVDGVDVTEKSSQEISDLIKNKDSDYVTLTVKREEEELTFNIKKETLINPSISYNIIEGTNIGYIYIENFSENLNKQVSSALEYLEGENITSLIIDVRNNVGGYLSAAESTSSLFLSEGKVIYSLENNNNTYTYKDKTKEKRTYPIVVLINGGTASAAEILASALSESYNATLVGSKSYGKGKVQQVLSLNNGSSVKYTSAKWLTPKGVCIDGIGITPDYEIDLPIESTVDVQLDKAIELLK